MLRGRKGEREGGRKEGREEGRERGREGAREGGREGGRKGINIYFHYSVTHPDMVQYDRYVLIKNGWIDELSVNGVQGPKEREHNLDGHIISSNDELATNSSPAPPPPEVGGRSGEVESTYQGQGDHHGGEAVVSQLLKSGLDPSMWQHVCQEC